MQFIKELFSIFLTNFNQILLYFCSLMNHIKSYIKNTLLGSVLFCCSAVCGQTASTQIDAPEELTKLLNRKIELDRIASAKKLFTIQVYYGDFESSTYQLEQFKTIFPELPAKIIFETPNYKIRAGNFTTEREALAALEKIQRKFRSAFVLKP